jgi:hypothetical protein
MQLASKILSLFGTSPKAELTFKHLYERVHPRSAEQLALVLSSLVNEGQLNQFVRVQSPTTHGGLQDFPSILEVPDEIHDIHSDTWIPVAPENMVVMYRK